MNTTTAVPTTRRAGPSPAVAAGIAFTLSTACTAIAIFGPQRQEDQIGAFPALVVAAALITAVLFWFAVRPAAARGASPRRVLLLALLAMATLAVFWTGLPTILGVAALAVRPYAPASPTRVVGSWLAAATIVAHAGAAVVA